MSKQWTVDGVVKLYCDTVNDYRLLTWDFNDQCELIETLTAERDSFKAQCEVLSQELAALCRNGQGEAIATNGQ